LRSRPRPVFTRQEPRLRRPFNKPDGPVSVRPAGLLKVEEPEIGDLVLAYDEATGKTEPKPVTALIRPLPKAVLDVEIAGADGALARVAATADHPWLVVRGKGETAWVETLALKPGDQLVTQGSDHLTFKSATLRDGLTRPATPAPWWLHRAFSERPV
jgi:hypothetical protein